MQRRRILLVVSASIGLLLTIAAGGYTWFYRINPCEVRAVKEASTALEDQLRRYDHSYQFATSASRTELIQPVVMLQQIQLDTRDVNVPACLQTAKDELVAYMGSVIHAFQAYGASEPDAAISDWLSQSDLHYDNFSTELEEVKQCAPYCFR